MSDIIFDNHIPEALTEIDLAGEKVLDTISTFLVGDVSLRAPKKTGNLAGSYAFQRTAPLEREIGSPVEYAPDQEGINPDYKFRFTPHLLPSVEGNLSQIEQMAREGFSED